MDVKTSGWAGNEPQVIKSSLSSLLLFGGSLLLGRRLFGRRGRSRSHDLLRGSLFGGRLLGGRLYKSNKIRELRKKIENRV